MYKRVLVPLDGSPLAERALGHAERVVDPGGELILLEVVRSAPSMSLGGSEAVSAQRAEEFARQVREAAERPKAEAETYLQSVAARLTRKEVRVRVRVVEGHPVDRIVEAGRDADLIVMSTHGRTGIAHLLVGSVAERVVRHASVPVTVVR